MNNSPEILETNEPVCEATSFVFTEGPIWLPHDFWYFNNIRSDAMYRRHLTATAPD